MTETTLKHQCLECGATTGTVSCDGCKFEICRACGYRCACDELEGYYADLKAENEES